MSTHGETLRKWLAKRIPGDLCGLQLGEDWNLVTMVNRVDTRAGTINTVARIDHADAAEALATACLFSVAPALAEEVLLLRERTKKAEAERDALRAAVREWREASKAAKEAKAVVASAEAIYRASDHEADGEALDEAIAAGHAAVDRVDAAYKRVVLLAGEGGR